MHEKPMRMLVAGISFAVFWAIVAGFLGYGFLGWVLPGLALRAAASGFVLGGLTVAVLSVVAPIADPTPRS